MRAAVNLLWLIPGRVGGSEEYTLGLLRALSERSASADTVELFLQPALLERHPDLAGRFECHAAPRDVAVKPARFALESTWLAARTRNFDLVHHAGGVTPYRPLPPASEVKGARVVTIHDLQPLDLADNFSVVQQSWFRIMLPRVARTAERIIGPSAFTLARVRDLLGVPADRLDRVPPIHATASRPPGPAGLVPDAPYLLYPAMAHPHKRHIDAVEAMALLRTRHPDLRLVLTGAAAGASGEIAARIVSLGLEDRVDIRGRVPIAELDALWAGAKALVFPSIYEGFGNPIIEAMARGVPVVAADATAVGEVASDAALLVPPRDPAALAAGVDRVLTEPALVTRLVEAGRRRAADFDAESAVAALIGSYHRACEGLSPAR